MSLRPLRGTRISLRHLQKRQKLLCNLWLQQQSPRRSCISYLQMKQQRHSPGQREPSSRRRRGHQHMRSQSSSLQLIRSQSLSHQLTRSQSLSWKLHILQQSPSKKSQSRSRMQSQSQGHWQSICRLPLSQSLGLSLSLKLNLHPQQSLRQRSRS